MTEHRVSVASSKYTFVRRSLMAELDAARVVVQAVRGCSAKLGQLCPTAIHEAIALHDSLVDDHELPSAWCGAEAVEHAAAAERQTAESRATYQAFKGIDTAVTIAELEALILSLAGRLGPADRGDAERRYYQRKAWLETQAANGAER